MSVKQGKMALDRITTSSNVWMRYKGDDGYEIRKLVRDGSGGLWLVGIVESKKLCDYDIEQLDYHNPIDLTGLI